MLRDVEEAAAENDVDDILVLLLWAGEEAYEYAEGFVVEFAVGVAACCCSVSVEAAV